MQETLTWEEIREKARAVLTPRCKVCPQCNGRACAGKVPGPGGKGSGATFQRNFDYLKEHVKLQMDVIDEPFSADTSADLLGRTLRLPVLAAPIGMLAFNMSDALNEYTYACAVLDGMLQAGSLGMTGGGAVDECFFDPMRAIKERQGNGIPTFKPWTLPIIEERLTYAQDAGVPAFAIDVDTAGVPHAGKSKTPFSKKSPEDLRQIAQMTDIPLIVKGIMTPQAAERLIDTGVYGIVVSNHGGRVMDEGLSSAEVLPAIRRAVGGRLKIFADGGVRTGTDVFKMLALGADAVLIGRPYIVAAYGGGAEGVRIYTEKVRTELADAMNMCGCRTLADIGPDKIAVLP